MAATSPHSLVDDADEENVVLTVTRAVVGVFLAAHGLVHLLYLTRDADDASYAFTLKDSWLFSETVGRPVALALIAPTVAGLILVAMTIWHLPGLATLWPVVAVAAAGASLALLVAFWDHRLWFGVLVDVALIAVAVAWPGWVDRLIG